MTKLTKKDVLHVAELSNLKLTDSEIKKFLPQLTKIIKFVGTLSEVDTTKIEPTSQTTKLVNALREDVTTSSNSLNIDEYFKVKAILSKRT
ncbi:MAG: Asp-tRNA(Asn)/Glu-tRNA(Gln) amidotransferase subunit GatC [Candidatus Woesebacteria bacterium]|nr:Asp-tRNA(Asn)/Glu-tRNA(Gln) amidotransferase subunit GatC [Candidatus Woesebacteria bacterium]